MKELIIIIGIPFIMGLTLKILNVITYKEKEVETKEINLIQKEVDYKAYLKINEQIIKGEC